MISAVNRIHQQEGHQYHLQAEDLGIDQRAFEVRVYEGGSVLWRKRVPYDDLLQKGLDRPALDEELHALMEKTVHTVQAAIAKGKLP
jgi:hypothetical protein